MDAICPGNRALSRGRQQLAQVLSQDILARVFGGQLGRPVQRLEPALQVGHADDVMGILE